MNCEIYIIKNDINDKVYIGQTTQGSEERFKQHLKLLKSSEKQLIHKAIKKYGKEHFYFEVLETDLAINELDKREEYWIRYYDSVNCGYNLCYGGNQSRKPMNQILIDNKDEIIEKYNNSNVSIRTLSKKYGVSHHSISNLLKKNNIDVKSRNKKSLNLTEHEKIKIAEMYKEGYITKDIAFELNRLEAVVRRYRQYKCCA